MVRLVLTLKPDHTGPTTPLRQTDALAFSIRTKYLPFIALGLARQGRDVNSSEQSKGGIIRPSAPDTILFSKIMSRAQSVLVDRLLACDQRHDEHHRT